MFSMWRLLLYLSRIQNIYIVTSSTFYFEFYRSLEKSSINFGIGLDLDQEGRTPRVLIKNRLGLYGPIGKRPSQSDIELLIKNFTQSKKITMDLIIRLKNVWLNAYKYVSRVVGEFKLIRFYLYGKIFMFVKGEKFKVTKPDKKISLKVAGYVLTVPHVIFNWSCVNVPAYTFIEDWFFDILVGFDFLINCN